MLVEVAPRFAGPPGIGHGGYVAGLLVGHWARAAQVTLRRPTPLGTPLRLEGTDAGDAERAELWHDDQLIAEAAPAPLALAVPPPPDVDGAVAAEAGSPSFYGGRGVHPTCFGCGAHRAPGDGMGIAAGPVEVDGWAQVAALWHPSDTFADADGQVDRRFVVAALDCPGAFAFISNGQRVGLLGRMAVEQYAPVTVGAPHIVTGWRIGVEDRKHFAGTALFTAGGELVAAAEATWFAMRSGPRP